MKKRLRERKGAKSMNELWKWKSFICGVCSTLIDPLAFSYIYTHQFLTMRKTRFLMHKTLGMFLLLVRFPQTTINLISQKAFLFFLAIQTILMSALVIVFENDFYTNLILFGLRAESLSFKMLTDFKQIRYLLNFSWLLTANLGH